MTVEQYENITGTVVSASQQAVVAAQILRSRNILETLLGFTLDPKKINKNLYKELGKTQTECPCPSVESETLDPADEVVNAYRLYSYNPKDKYLHVDPFTKLNAVKLVNDGVTVKTFESSDLRPEYAEGWSKFIENCELCSCLAECNCVQLAVDADWLGNCEQTPIDYVWADMVTYYVDCKTNIKSETIGSHSYTKFDKVAPETIDSNLAILKKYAGPNGSLTKVYTV